MKKTLIAVLVASLISPVISAIADDRANFQTYAKTDENPLMIKSGMAVVDVAMSKIIPSPYRILIDSSVPSSMMVVWHDGNNWMEVLKDAVAPMGLVATPDWNNNTVTIAWGKGKKPAIPKTMTGSFGVMDTALSVPEPTVQSSEYLKKTEDRLYIGKTDGMAVSYTKTYTADRNGLPDFATLFDMRVAIGDGGEIIVTGFSGVKNESSRVKWANYFAEEMKKKLVQLGFAEDKIVVRKRTDYEKKGDKPRVEFFLIKKEV
jgi:hypothetical protein